MVKVILFAFLISLITCDPYSATKSYSFAPTSDIKTATFEMIRFFLDLNKNAYCYYENFSSKCLSCSMPAGITTSLTIKGREKDKNKSYNYYIFKSTTYKKIYVAFPGTRGDFQLISEGLQSGLTKYNSYRIVNYFKDRADALRSKVNKDLTTALSGASDYQVIFTGHSLGGAVASVMALYMTEDGIISKSKHRTTIVTFGQPKTGDLAFKNKVMSIAKVIRIVRDHDKVTEIGLDLGKQDLYHLGGEVLLNHNLNAFYNCPNGFTGSCAFQYKKKWDAHSYLPNDAGLSEVCGQ